MSFFQLGRQQEILFLVQLNYFLKEVVSNLNQIIFSTFAPSNLSVTCVTLLKDRLETC